VQLCVDLALHQLAGMDQPPPDTMGETFERLAQAGELDPALALALKKAVGFRNLAVHSYAAIDWAIVHAIAIAIATGHLDDFARFARTLTN